LALALVQEGFKPGKGPPVQLGRTSAFLPPFPELRLAVGLRSRESRIRADSHLSVAPGLGTCPLTSTVSICRPYNYRVLPKATNLLRFKEIRSQLYRP